MQASLPVSEYPHRLPLTGRGNRKRFKYSRSWQLAGLAAGFSGARCRGGFFRFRSTIGLARLGTGISGQIASLVGTLLEIGFVPAASGEPERRRGNLSAHGFGSTLRTESSDRGRTASASGQTSDCRRRRGTHRSACSRSPSHGSTALPAGQGKDNSNTADHKAASSRIRRIRPGPTIATLQPAIRPGRLPPARRWDSAAPG